MAATEQCIGWSRSARTRFPHPRLLRYPVVGMSMALAMAAPCGASPRPDVARVSVSAGLTGAQSRVLHRYERYLARIAAQRQKARRVVRFAYRQIGKPYRWGGAGPRSYDCSGLAMTAWRRGGLRLPHRADLQYHVIPRKVSFRHLRPGDLVFFSGAGHVGIYVGHGRFIHAPHTGTVVQRGTLTGWRRHAFFGAARPGAPAYRRWPRWVRRLVGRSPDDDGAAGPVWAPPMSVGVLDPAALLEPGDAESVDTGLPGAMTGLPADWSARSPAVPSAPMPGPVGPGMAAPAAPAAPVG